MGKNTMMKRFIRVHAEKIGNRDLLNPIPLLQGNVGLVFTKGDLKEVKDEVAKYKAVANISKVLPKDTEAPHRGVDDKTKLSHLHEPGILHNLAMRYELNEIYDFAMNQSNKY